MAVRKTEGIVLRARAWHESSKIITVCTRDFGKVALVAKGARRPRSGQAASLEPFTHIEVVYQEKVGRDLDILTSVSVKETFRKLREDFLGMARASYLVQLVEELVRGKEKSIRIFTLLLDALHDLEGTQDADMLIRFFELRLLDTLGYRPRLDACVSCQRVVALSRGVSPRDTSRFHFSARLGGLLCSPCGKVDREAHPISSGAVATLRHLKRVEREKLPRLKVSLLIRGGTEEQSQLLPPALPG